MEDGKTPIPNHLIFDNNLRAREWQVLATIHYYCHTYGMRYCWPTQAEMGERLEMKTDTVKKIVNRLVEKAYIGKIRLKNKETGKNQLVYYPTTWVNGTGKKEPNNPFANMPLHMYYKTPQWKQRSSEVREKVGKCQVCCTSKGLEVHHNTYDRLGDELDSDLIVLCRDCHQLFHSNSRLKR